MIRPKKTQKPTFASILRSMREMPTGVSHGRAPWSQAPIVGALRNQVPTPAGRGRGEELVSATLGEDPVRHSEDPPVELDDPGHGTIAHLSGDSLSRPCSSSDSQGRVPGAAGAATQKGTFNQRHSYDPCAGTGVRVGFPYRRRLTVCRLTDP
jgi:hypothetical protein